MRAVRKHLRSNVVGYIALIVALSGTAGAVNGPLPGKNKVGTQDIIDGEVKAADLNPGSVKNAKLGVDSVEGSKVLDGSLTGADIGDGTIGQADLAGGSVTGNEVVENTLAQVPSALLGGVGRSSTTGGSCDPSSTTFLTCGNVTINLPAPSRVLVVATIRADYIPSGSGIGDCVLATSFAVIPGTDVRVVAQTGNIEFVTLTAVAPVLGPGPVDYGIECNEISGTIIYSDMQVSAVALSSS